MATFVVMVLGVHSRRSAEAGDVGGVVVGATYPRGLANHVHELLSHPAPRHAPRQESLDAQGPRAKEPEQGGFFLADGAAVANIVVVEEEHG
jgi:hypothetical protein